MNRRSFTWRMFAVGAGALLGGCGAAVKGPAGRKPVVGFMILNLASNAQDFSALRDGMSKQGWIDPKNVTFAARSAEGAIETVAAELVALPCDVIVTSNSTCALALQKATKTLPIVMAGVQEPEALGLVASLDAPGGNITGICRLTTQLAAKRLEILREIFPDLTRVTVIWDSSPGARLNLRETEAAARKGGLMVEAIAVKTADDLRGAVAAAQEKRAEVVLLHGGLFRAQRTRISELLTHAKIPSMASDSSYAESGILLSYGEDAVDLFHRAARFVDKILHGANPASLPVELPTAFEFAANRRTAQAVAVTIPTSVASRVTKWFA